MCGTDAGCPRAAGVKNGNLLRRGSGQVAALVTMDRKLEREHDLTALSFGVVVILARSNRVQDLRPLIVGVLDPSAASGPGKWNVLMPDTDTRIEPARRVIEPRAGSCGRQIDGAVLGWQAHRQCDSLVRRSTPAAGQGVWARCGW